MCGAGVAMAISDDMKNWEDFVDQFARKVKEVLGLTDNWIEIYRSKDFMDKIDYVEKQINTGWTNYPTEIHRMIAQIDRKSVV